ncbi:F-box protein [Quillaja saponaria]|uniref:F-box protein n=1 Tax=Quillaja saponaria TaxID=32244 RepID=A0AAD7L2Q9_QUISA|nr:F-box protein [Quillaja saponaria]
MQTPSFVFKNYFCLQEVQLVIRISFNDLDNTWFLKLRKDLAMLSKYLVVVTLDLFLGHVNAKFTRMHLDGSLRPSPHSLNCLKLNRVPSTIDYSAFIEGLLWSCYPKNLLVDLHQQQDQKFIEFLYATLTSRDENPSCCKDIKACICWRHFLDNVKVVTDTSEGIRYGLHRNALDKTAVGEGSYLTFQLEWRERSKLHSSQFDKWPFSTKFRKALCFT